jgi:hypothetical protein
MIRTVRAEAETRNQLQLVCSADGRDPRFVSVAQPLALATGFFCGSVFFLLRTTGYPAKDDSTELDPRYSSNVLALAVSWGIFMLGWRNFTNWSALLASATHLRAKADTLKAAQPKLALAMVYVVLAVVLSTTSGGSIAALFGEAFAQANLLLWAALLAVSGLGFRESGALTAEVVLELRMTKPEAGLVAGLLTYFLVTVCLAKSPTSALLADMARWLFACNFILAYGWLASTKTVWHDKLTASRFQESNGGSVQLVPIITEGPKSMLTAECVRLDDSGQEVLHLTLDITGAKKAVVFASGFGGSKFTLGNVSDAVEFVHLKSGELEEVGGRSRVLEVHREDSAIAEGVENRRQAEDDHQTWTVGHPGAQRVVSPSDAEGLVLVLNWVPCPDRCADERGRHMQLQRQRAAAAAAAAAVAALAAAAAAAAAAADRAAVAAAVAVAAPVVASSEIIKNPVAPPPAVCTHVF